MNAERLRAAATRLREVAGQATPGPWASPVANVFRVIAPEAEHSNPPMGVTPPYPWRIVAEASEHDPFVPDMAYIATLHPGVALALADWLDDVADHDPSPLMPTEAGAFKVADAVLGGEQP